MPKETVRDEARMWDIRVGWTPEKWVQVGVEQSERYGIVSALYGNSVGAIGAAAAEIFKKGFNEGWTLDDETYGSLPAFGGEGVTSTEDIQRWREALGLIILNLVTGNPSNVNESGTGLWSTLDREGINRLIRILRRARDSAFGQDA